MAESRSSTSVTARLDTIERQIKQILEMLQGGAPQPSQGTTIELTTGELDQIGDILDELDSRLTDRQRLYMLGILGAAAHHFEQVLSTEGPSVENIRQVQVSSLEQIRQVKISDAFHGMTNVERGQLGTVSPGANVMDSVGVSVGVACIGGDWTKDLGSQQMGAWRTYPAFSGGNVAGGGAAGGPLGGLPGGFGR